MSVPIKKPQLINTAQDPALQYLMQHEIQTALTPVENVSKNIVLEQLTQVVTNVIQVNAPQGANGAIQFNQNGSYVGDTGLQFEPTTDTLTTGTVIANSITINGNLKLSGGYNRNFLTTDGAGNTSWADVLPSSVGKSGKFLVTNGVAESWSTISYSSFATQTDVANAINTLVGTAPGILDTLAEIANVIGATDNPEFSIVSQLANKANISNLADVAFSGLYSDLSNLPTISTAGTTGNYEDLRNKPTIPVTIMDLGISDGTIGQVLTANGNGTYHFTTANSGASTGNITFADNTLTGTGDVKIHFTPSASPAVEFNFASNGSLTLPDGLTIAKEGPYLSSIGKDTIIGTAIFNTKLFVDYNEVGITSTLDVENMPNETATATVKVGGAVATLLSTDDDAGDPVTQYRGQLDVSYSGITLTLANPTTVTNWVFDDNNLKLPAGGDIVDSTGTSVLGGSGGNGASAYDVAVTNGFSGTEQEWLASLVGADGADGTSFTFAGQWDFSADHYNIGDVVRDDSNNLFIAIQYVPQSTVGLSNTAFWQPFLQSGQNGADGQGVPIGGTSGQVLAKVDGTDYNTQWVNQPGSISTGNITFTGDSIGSSNNIVSITASNYAELNTGDSYIWTEASNASIQVGGSRWIFSDPTVAGGSSSNLLAAPNGVYTRSGDSVICDPNMDTVIYTSTYATQHTLKLLLCIEGLEDGQTIEDTQSCEMIVARSTRINSVAGSVYGLVYTSVAPLATLSARWNAISSRVEITCRPTSILNSVSVHSTVTELDSTI